MISAYNGSMITWARERNGLSTQDVANTLRVPEATVLAWERDEIGIAYTKLEALCDRLLKIPLAVLFMPEPPPIDDPVGNFRRLPEYERTRFSSDTLLKIRLAQTYQESVLQLLSVDDAPQIHQDISPEGISVRELASRVRDYLGVDLDTQFGFTSTRAAFKYWRHALEEAGVFTFKDSFSDEFISGFCLLDETRPIIMINNSNSFTRQIFTLFHELGHILFNVHGVSDIDERYLDYFGDEDKTIERDCNKFAAELLVPIDRIQQDFHIYFERGDQGIADLARRYSVSREVILRRLLDRGIISDDEYSEKSNEWNTDFRRRARDASGGDWYLTKLSYLGEGFSRLALDRYRSGRVNIASLADHLNVRAIKIPRFTTYLED